MAVAVLIYSRLGPSTNCHGVGAPPELPSRHIGRYQLSGGKGSIVPNLSLRVNSCYQEGAQELQDLDSQLIVAGKRQTFSIFFSDVATEKLNIWL